MIWTNLRLQGVEDPASLDPITGASVARQESTTANLLAAVAEANRKKAEEAARRYEAQPARGEGSRSCKEEGARVGAALQPRRVPPRHNGPCLSRRALPHRQPHRAGCYTNRHAHTS